MKDRQTDGSRDVKPVASVVLRHLDENRKTESLFATFSNTQNTT